MNLERERCKVRFVLNHKITLIMVFRVISGPLHGSYSLSTRDNLIFGKVWCLDSPARPIGIFYCCIQHLWIMTGNEWMHMNLDAQYQRNTQAFVVRRNILEPFLFTTDDLLLEGTFDIYYKML